MSGTRHRLRRLDRVVSDHSVIDEAARIVIYDPAGARPEAGPGITFFLPHNDREPMPVGTTAPAASGAA